MDDRGRLTGKVKQGLEESTAFTKLFQRIQNHFNDDQMVAIVAHNVKQVWQACGNSMPDLSDLVQGNTGQVEFYGLLDLGQVKYS